MPQRRHSRLIDTASQPHKQTKQSQSHTFECRIYVRVKTFDKRIFLDKSMAKMRLVLSGGPELLHFRHFSYHLLDSQYVCALDSGTSNVKEDDGGCVRLTFQL